jgi:hypothetical protein
MVTVDETSDGVRMSAVLEEFIAPFFHAVEADREAFDKLLTIAAAAWNIALLPAESRETHTQQLLETLPQDVREDTRAIIDDLIARKEAHFPEYKRIIVDYEVTDAGDEYQLVVASTALGVETD